MAIWCYLDAEVLVLPPPVLSSGLCFCWLPLFVVIQLLHPSALPRAGLTIFCLLSCKGQHVKHLEPRQCHTANGPLRVAKRTQQRTGPVVVFTHVRTAEPVRFFLRVAAEPTCKNINRSHTHTPTENKTPDTDTHTHDKNDTPNPQTNTPHKHLTTLEGVKGRYRQRAGLDSDSCGGVLCGVSSYLLYVTCVETE